MEFKSKQSKKKNLAFLKLYTIVQQYFSSMEHLSATSLCYTCVHCRDAWVQNCRCYSCCCTHTFTSNTPLRISISWFLHFLPHFILLLLTRSHFLYQHNALVIKRTAGHVVKRGRLCLTSLPPHHSSKKHSYCCHSKITSYIKQDTGLMAFCNRGSK